VPHWVRFAVDSALRDIGPTGSATASYTQRWMRLNLRTTSDCPGSPGQVSLILLYNYMLAMEISAEIMGRSSFFTAAS